jgi:3-methyladenine DNA glycosylase AlkD
MTIKTINNISEKLLELAKGNEEYAIFSKKIVNTEMNVLGVRSSDMRKLGKNLSKDLDFNDVLKFLQVSNKNIHEEVSLSGLLIAYSKLTDKEKIKLAKLYLLSIDNWGLVDGFVSSFKKIDKDLWWNFVVECLGKNEEFIVRF